MSDTIRPKKILYVITKANFGGAQRYVFELASYSKQCGHEVAVATGSTGELTERLAEFSIPYFVIPGLERDLGITKELRAIFGLYRVMRDYVPDVVHLNSGKAGLLGALAACLARVPRSIFTAHGWSFLEPRPWWWKSLTFAGSYLTALLVDTVIVVSQNDLRHTRMPGVQRKTVLITTAVHNFPRLSREDARAALYTGEIIEAHRQDIWLVTTAELNHNKNHVTAIDAVAEFNSTHSTKIFYSIIGTGELEVALIEQAALRGLREYVTFSGYLPDARQYLAAFDVFLLPSKKEGLPYALLEAGQTGLPCVASNVGGIPEVITDKVSGLLIEPHNHMSIVNALEYLLDNPDARTHMSEALEQHIKTNYSLSQMQQETVALY